MVGSGCGGCCGVASIDGEPGPLWPPNVAGAFAIFFELVRLTAELAGVRVLRNASTPMARRGVPFPEKRPRRAEIVTVRCVRSPPRRPSIFFFLIVLPHVFDVFASPHVLVKHPFFVHTFVCIYQNEACRRRLATSTPGVPAHAQQIAHRAGLAGHSRRIFQNFRRETSGGRWGFERDERLPCAPEDDAAGAPRRQEGFLQVCIICMYVSR